MRYRMIAIKEKELLNRNSLFCRDDWIRTSDPLDQWWDALSHNFNKIKRGCLILFETASLMSGRLDSNQRPLAPHASALPGCATSRNLQITILQISFYTTALYLQL
jgi:hypothetical protein